MDSLTQIVLGAAVGEATLGKKVGNRAMLWGAIAGTIPDLDVFTRHFTDPISANLMHRGFTHSLLFCILLAPILGYAVKKSARWSFIGFFAIISGYLLLSIPSIVAQSIVVTVFLILSLLSYRYAPKTDEASIKGWTLLFFLSLVTHPLLDAHTDWGTQFFWPFEYRLAYKNIFVADPLYTLPFLLCVVTAMFFKRTNPKRRFFNNAGLFISSGYMLLSLFFKGYAHAHFEDELSRQGIEYVEMDTRPTPLNTILWNAQIETKNGYIVGYYSLFDKDYKVQFSHEFAKNKHIKDSLGNPKVLQQLERFTAGWYRMHYEGDKLFLTDIRFGQFGVDPNNSPFIWQYEVFKDENGEVQAVQVPRRFSGDQMGEAISGLWSRINGTKPEEASNQ